MTNNLVELRKQAEQAVRDMPDGDLKVKAFETILGHLLLTSGMHVAPAKKSPSEDKLKSGNPPTSATERLHLLKGDGFFSAQRSIEEVRQELKKYGWHYPITSLSGPLQVQVQKRELRRERVVDKNGRKGWRYSNP